METSPSTQSDPKVSSRKVLMSSFSCETVRISFIRYILHDELADIKKDDKFEFGSSKIS